MKTLALVILLTGTCAYGQDVAMVESSSLSVYGISLPEAPKPQVKKHAMDRTDWTLLGTDATLRITDAYSTRRFLSCPTSVCHEEEKVLPDFISHHTATMYAYSATVVGFDYLLSRQLKRHGHTKLAKLVYITDIAVEAPTLSNLTLPIKPKANVVRFKWRGGL